METKSVKVCFDTNVYNRIFDEPQRDIYRKIIDKTIEPYISETIFTLEGIQRKDRKEVLSKQKAKIDSNIESENSEFKMTLKICSSKKSHISLTDQQKKRLFIAESLGFKILLTFRLAGFINTELMSLYSRMIMKHENNENETFATCARYIEDKLFAGKFILAKDLSHRYSSTNFSENIKKLMNDKKVGNNKIAKFIAEWSDGDSIAAAVAYGMDYFCTNDQAKSANFNSVFLECNRMSIEKEFGIKIVSAQELVSKMQVL